MSKNKQRVQVKWWNEHGVYRKNCRPSVAINLVIELKSKGWKYKIGGVDRNE